MSVQFSGTFHRFPIPKETASSVSGSGEHLFIAEIDEAAKALNDKIRQEVPEHMQISFQPKEPYLLWIQEKTSDGFRTVSEKDENGQSITPWTSRQYKESAQEFLLRGIQFSKDLNAQLTAARSFKKQAKEASATISGWIAPQVKVTPDVALSYGAPVANQLKKTILKLAPSLKQLPPRIALVVDSNHGYKNIRLSVVKKDEKGNTTDFHPTTPELSPLTGQYENEIAQKINPFSPFHFSENSIFSWLNRYETTQSLLKRGIAHAHTLARQEKEVAEYKTAYQSALADSHGNFEIESPEIISIHGLPHALTLVQTLKNASERLHKISPDLKLRYYHQTGTDVPLDYRVDRESIKEGSLMILFKVPGNNEYYSIFGTDQDSEKDHVSRKRGESLEKFVDRTLGLAAQYLQERRRRDALRGKLTPTTDTGLSVGDKS